MANKPTKLAIGTVVSIEYQSKPIIGTIHRQHACGYYDVYLNDWIMFLGEMTRIVTCRRHEITVLKAECVLEAAIDRVSKKVLF